MEAFCHAAPDCGLSATHDAGNGSAQGDLLTERDLAREPVKEPLKGWRNWWRCELGGHKVLLRNGRTVRLRAGEEWRGRLWPSRDICVTVATESKATNVVWLGAFPEGERP